MKSYAVLLAPEFRLQSVLRYLPHLLECPVALLEMLGAKPRVSEFNAAAGACYMQRGMSPTQALARCADLHLVNGNAGQERSAQEAMLQTAETLSPFLESTGPGVVTVELPSERTISQEELAKRIVEPLRSLGLDVKVGVAATPDLARLAARYGNQVNVVLDAAEFLSPLPVDVLGATYELRSVLESWGIRTISQLVALPMAQVCERLGPEAVELWQRATGGRFRPLKLVKPQEFFAEQTDLENPVEMLEPLLFLLRRFLEQITARLANVYLVVGKLRLILRFDNGARYERVFAIPAPTREVDVLFRMLHTHLENFSSESPIVGLDLAAKPARPTVEQWGLLDKGLRDPHQFAETLGRLEALLGRDRVGSPEGDTSHHPDGFCLRAYESGEVLAEPDEAPLLGVPWLRFRPPVAANVILREVRPAFLYSNRTTGPIKDARGPWLMEGNWWDRRHWAREEWDVVTDDGIYRLVRADAKWFLDGVYV